MGTASVELTLPRVVEVLGPDGQYERGRVALRAEHGPVLEGAKKLTVIGSAEEAETVTNFGRLLQAATAETEKFYKTVKVMIDEIKKPVLAAEHQDVDAYEAEKRRLGSLLTVWHKKVKEAQAEADRIAREEALKKEQEAQLMRAIEIEELEGTEAAEQVLAEPIIVFTPVTQSAAGPKPKGSVSSTVYRGRVDNLMDLVVAIANGKAPLQAVMVNESFINNQAKQFREAFSMPGCSLVKADSTGFRR